MSVGVAKDLLNHAEIDLGNAHQVHPGGTSGMEYESQRSRSHIEAM